MCKVCVMYWSTPFSITKCYWETLACETTVPIYIGSVCKDWIDLWFDSAAAYVEWHSPNGWGVCMFMITVLFATTTHRLHCFVPIFAMLNPHVKVVTLIIIKCSNSWYYIAQRKNTITVSNQTLTADIRIFSVLLSRRYPEEQLDERITAIDGGIVVMHSWLCHGVVKKGDAAWTQGTVSVLTDSSTQCDILNPHCTQGASLIYPN